MPSGIVLKGDRFGSDGGHAVLLAHGGGQTRHAWRSCGAKLGRAGYHAVAIDLRGHGKSDWSPDGDYRVDRFAEDLLAVADTFDRPPVLVGASLGGSSGLLAQGEYALQDRRGFAGLVLVDIAPRIRQEGADKVLGFMAENVDTGFASLQDAADAVARYLPHRPRPKNLDGLAKNLRQKADGRYYWHWDPRFVASSQRSQGDGRTQRMEAAAQSLTVPALLIRGTNSELVDAAAVQRFAELVPHAEIVDIAGAGHMVAGDRNDRFNSTILEFLQSWSSGQGAGASGSG
ncbi:alpha/beta fold hydrolase [Vreelandella titanicae]|uniref:alpha/beta fold hydrolase n=1 Tax=Vreelandella titanicae TaxID=664683 RepID=UPI00191C2D72|nr:alpha/beta hydrolase [Halomonas titanicae]